MKRYGMLFLLGVLTLTSCAQQQKAPNGPNKKEVPAGKGSAVNTTGDQLVFARELATFRGQWMGTLTYLDYQSGEPYTMKANIRIDQATPGSDSFQLVYEYPNEPKANSTGRLVISDNGRMLNGETVIKKTWGDDQLLIITEKDGEDDDKKALIRHTYTITSHSFTFQGG